MTTTAHEDQFTAAPEPVRRPYDAVAILRHVAALEVALKQQTELKEKAEAELAKLAQQSPIKYMYRVTDCFGYEVLRDDPKGATILETIPLYAAHVPASHKGATHCDDCGLTWLDDGLNPLGCPYCKDIVPAPAVPAEWRETLSKLVGIVESSTKFHGCDDVTKQARALLQSADRLLEGGE